MAESKKAKRLSKEEIKKQLLDSMIIDQVTEFENWNKEAEEVQYPEEAAEIIKRYEDFIKTKKKRNINVAYHQGQVSKRFREKEKFAKLVSELRIHKTTIIFKINIFKLCEKYRKLLKSSIGLGFFKNYHKDIKAICEENEKDFQCWAFLSFKTKSVTQVFITDIQAKIWKSLYAFIFIWICIYFSVYKFLSCVSVIGYIKN